MRELRIHGDNIVECERALEMLAESLGVADVGWVDSPLHAPKFVLSDPADDKLLVQLFPGYGRWDASITEALRASGAPLAEAADAIITEYRANSDGGRGVEQLLIAIEFCGALPAGNNAWQRCGRSYSYAITGVPYLYISEFGGYELASDRTLKSPRFPNPLVPFAYATQSQLSSTFALPVYVPSPSISDAMRSRFEPVFGWDLALAVLAAVVHGGDRTIAVASLLDTGLEATIAVAERRRPASTLSGDTWRRLFSLRGNERVEELASVEMPWAKRISIPVTASFRAFLQVLAKVAVGAGATDMPFGIIPKQHRSQFANDVQATYGNPSPLTSDFLKWLAKDDQPLVVVLLAGFKPRGDDSRPDRGLLPLVRMLFGEDCAVLTVVYGPGSPAMWARYMSAPAALEKSNGLWQAVLRLSDGVMIDSPTCQSPDGRLAHRKRDTVTDDKPVVFPAAIDSPSHSEHDVDTIIKMIAASEDRTIFEGLCNPPGGDWSGISLVDESAGLEHRWTSLPRVSGSDGKRPDHVLQFTNSSVPDMVFSIESKERSQDFEVEIGPRLVKYVRDLVVTPATITRDLDGGEWVHNAGSTPVHVDVISAGAFVDPGTVAAVIASARQNQLDAAIAISFPTSGTAHLTIACNERASGPVSALVKSAGRLGNRVVIEVHRF